MTFYCKYRYFLRQRTFIGQYKLLIRLKQTTDGKNPPQTNESRGPGRGRSFRYEEISGRLSADDLDGAEGPAVAVNAHKVNALLTEGDAGVLAGYGIEGGGTAEHAGGAVDAH